MLIKLLQIYNSKNYISSLLPRLYHAKIIDHYENPRNVGLLDNADINVGTGLVGTPACGDVMKLQIKVNKEGIIFDKIL